MLSFGAMVFVKRKHMMMKQSALNTMRGEYIEKKTPACGAQRGAWKWNQQWVPSACCQNRFIKIVFSLTRLVGI